MDEVFNDLRSYIAYRVREGFESPHEIVENATSYACEQHGRDDLRRVIQRITAELLEKHRAQQSEWQSPTDCDRLDEAFAALEKQGIVARQDFTCCTNCGHAEIWDEIEKVEEQRPVEGYVFYHMQCTETAIKTGELWLAYGCIDEGAEALARVANKVVHELRRVGLNASWAGDSRYPITIDGLVWHRRRAPSAEVS